MTPGITPLASRAAAWILNNLWPECKAYVPDPRQLRFEEIFRC